MNMKAFAIRKLSASRAKGRFEKEESKRKKVLVRGNQEGTNGGVGLASFAVGFATLAYVVTRLGSNVHLEDLAKDSIPWDVATSNGKPSVVEFYADWCEVCKELAPNVLEAEREYGERVNFVLLNVDNAKWDAELNKYEVEGVPHFVFLDEDGTDRGEAVGRIPRDVLLENTLALMEGRDLPRRLLDRESVTPLLSNPRSNPSPMDHS